VACVALLSSCGPLEQITADSKWIDRVLMVIMIMVLFIFFLFTLLKLDQHVKWSWYVVMIPLFIVKGLLVLIPMALTLFVSCTSYSTKRKTRWSKDPGILCIMATVIAVVLLVPLLTFEILLAQRAQNDNHLSYAKIFAPLFIIEGCSVVGCVVLNIMAFTA